MAFTRFNDDPCRITKKLQQMTDPGRWVLNVPGNGDKPCFIADPQIILQGWGANLRTNTINLESELLGVNKRLNKDCLGEDEYERFSVNSKEIEYPVCINTITEQSRAIMPAWTARDLEQVNSYPLILDAQENTCLPFQNNLNTRILERDYFVRNMNFMNMSASNILPREVEVENKNIQIINGMNGIHSCL
jgi:hypothetical protein